MRENEWEISEPHKDEATLPVRPSSARPPATAASWMNGCRLDQSIGNIAIV